MRLPTGNFWKAWVSISGKTIKGQVQAGLRLLYDDDAAGKMKENQAKNINKLAAEDIRLFTAQDR